MLKKDLTKPPNSNSYDYSLTLKHFVYEDDKATGIGKKYKLENSDYSLENDNIFKVKFSEMVTIRSINKNLINEEIKVKH